MKTERFLPPPPPTAWIVAIPAKDEALRVEGCLRALDRAATRSALPVTALVLANDCTDETASLCRRVAPQLRRARVAVSSVTLEPSEAHAGGARRRAVREALARSGAGADDLLLTTDADSRLDPDALAAMETAFAGGADLVLARIACIADPFDPVPQAVLDWGTPQVLWRHRVRQLAETIRSGVLADPRCHDDYGGAGLAARVGAYHALGGFPSVPSEEDLRFVRAADAAGWRVDRSSGAKVEVMARATGRAEGGMATALATNALHLARRTPRLVERHDLTVARLREDPSPARIFCPAPGAVEPVEDAIRGIDGVLSRYASELRP